MRIKSVPYLRNYCYYRDQYGIHSNKQDWSQRKQLTEQWKEGLVGCLQSPFQHTDILSNREDFSFLQPQDRTLIEQTLVHIGMRLRWKEKDRKAYREEERDRRESRQLGDNTMWYNNINTAPFK